MSMKKEIITKLISPPRFKKRHLYCAYCFACIIERFPVGQTKGEFECDVCGAKTSWQEVDELTTLEKDAIVGGDTDKENIATVHHESDSEMYEAVKSVYEDTIRILIRLKNLLDSPVLREKEGE